MSRFMYTEYVGDDAGEVLRKLLGSDAEPFAPVETERDNTSRIVGFAPNPEQPELDIPDEDEEDDD